MISQLTKPTLVTFTGERMGTRVTVSALIAALEKALIWLRGRDPNATVDWDVVKIRIDNRLRLTFSSTEDISAIPNRLHMLHELEKKRKPKLSPRLTEEDIDGTQELASMIGEDFVSMKISSPGAPTVKLTPTLVERVEEIAQVARGVYYEWGTMRGYMDQVTIGERKCTFRIRNQLTNDDIGCSFPLEELNAVKAALPARVEVYGRIKMNRSDKPTSIDVEKFRILPENLRPFNEEPPVNITDGMDSGDFVEGIRSAS